MEKYKVFFTNGQIIEIYADDWELISNDRVLRFELNEDVVGFFNFYNINGFIEVPS